MNVLQTQSVYQCLPFLCWPGWLLHAQPGGGVRAKWMSLHICTCTLMYMYMMSVLYMYMYVYIQCTCMCDCECLHSI